MSLGPAERREKMTRYFTCLKLDVFGAENRNNLRHDQLKEKNLKLKYEIWKKIRKEIKNNKKQQYKYNYYSMIHPSLSIINN